MFCSEFLPSSLFWLLILNVRREVCGVLLPTQTVRCNFCVDSTFSFQKIITLVTLRCSTGLSGQSEEGLLCSVDTLLTTSCHPLLPLSSLHGGNSFSLLACVICSTAVYGISYEGKAQYEQWKYLLLFWIAIDFFLLFIKTQLKVLSWIWSLNNLVDQGTDIYLKDKNAARVVHFLDENRWR